MTKTEPFSKYPEDLADLPEELLRHSLLLFAPEEATAATADEPSLRETADQMAQTAPANTPEEATADVTLYPGADNPTYHQLVKRELAGYLRHRAACSDQHRESVRQLSSARRPVPPVLRTPPPEAPVMRSTRCTMDAPSKPAGKLIGQAVAERTSTLCVTRAVSRQQVTANIRSQASGTLPTEPRKAPATKMLHPHELQPLSAGKTGDRCSCPQPPSRPQLDRQETKPSWELPRSRPAVATKNSSKLERRSLPERSHCGQLTLELLTLERPSKRPSSCGALGPLAALQL